MTGARKTAQAGIVGLTVLGLLAGCADEPAPVVQREHRHVSPTPVAAPRLPPGSFDQVQAQAELAVARDALAAGQMTEARQAAVASIDHWPADPVAWETLGAACQAANDADCVRRAALFKDKVEYVNPLPARVAVLGFQSLAEEEPGESDNGATYDPETIAIAARMWAFYATRDPMVTAHLMAAPVPDGDWIDQHPYGGMAIFAGVAAILLTVAKSATGGGTTH